MARFKHQAVPFDTITGTCYRCTLCGDTNYCWNDSYPYPAGWHFFKTPEVHAVHCPESNVKITWWERLTMAVNLMLKETE